MKKYERSNSSDNTKKFCNVRIRFNLMIMLNNYIRHEKLTLEEIVEKFHADPTTVLNLLRCKLAYLSMEELLAMISHYNNMCDKKLQISVLAPLDNA